MKNKKLRIFASLFIAFMMMATIILAACPSTPPPTPPEPLTGITIALPSGASTTWTMGELPVEAQRRFTATPTPTDAELGTVTWHSSDATVLTVNAGLVNAVRDGHAYIYARSGTIESNRVRITVQPEAGAPVLTGVSVTPVGPLNMALDAIPNVENRTLTAVPQPAGASLGTVTWTSTVPAVASVEGGVVTPLTAGHTYITAQAGTFTSTPVRVNVTAGTVAPTGITITPNTLNLQVGATQTVQVAVQPANVTNAQFTWSGGAPATATVATVDGVTTVTAVAVGTTTWTATTVATPAQTATLTITVTPATQQAEADVIISSAAEFVNLTTIEGWRDMHIALGADINLTGWDITGVNGAGFTATDGGGGYDTEPFTGVFDGRGHRIYGVDVGVAALPFDPWQFGFFRHTDGAIIRNLHLSATRRSPMGQGGLLIGVATDTLIENVFVEGIVEGRYAGGVAGDAWRFNGAVVGEANAGTELVNVVANVRSYGEGVGGAAQIRFGAVVRQLSASTATNVFSVLDGFHPDARTGTGRPELAIATAAGATFTNAHAFMMADIGGIDFSALPASHWEFTTGQLPTLRRAPASDLPATHPVTGLNITGDHFISVAGSPNAFAGGVYAFSVRVNTAEFHGTPVVAATMGGVAVTPVLTAQSGPANAREFTFAIQNVTGPIVITGISGLTRFFAVTRPATDPMFVFRGEPFALQSQNYEFEVEANEGFQINAVYMVVGTEETELELPELNADGYLEMYIPHADIDGPFAIRVEAGVYGGRVQISGLREALSYSIMADLEYAGFAEFEENFEFILELTNNGTFQAVPNVTVAVTVETPTGNVVHNLQGVISNGIATFVLDAEYVVGDITIGAISGVYGFSAIGISTAAQFNAIMDIPGWQTATFYLTQDIDFTGVEVMPIGGTASLGLHGRLPAANVFRGTFDGRGFALQNITLTGVGHHWGLFRMLDGAHIRNLAITDMSANFVAAMNGMLAGWVNGSVTNPTIIENVYLHGSVIGGYGAAGSAWLRSAALIGRSARADAADGVSNFIVRNNVINVTATGHSFAAIIAYAPGGTVAAVGNRTIQNNFVVTSGFTPHAGAGAPFMIQAGQWTDDRTIQSGNVGFAMANVGTQNFDVLPEVWDTTGTGLPTLIEIEEPIDKAMMVPFNGLRTTANYTITSAAVVRADQDATFTVALRGGNEAEELSAVVSVRGGESQTLQAERNAAGNFEFTLPYEYIVGTVTIGTIIGFEFGWTAISNAEEFTEAFSAPGWQDRNFYLTTDIDFAEGLETPRGNVAAMSEFRGRLDGRGYALKNINITGATASWTEQGLFNTLNGATIRNLTIYNARLASAATYGQSAILAGVVNNSTIENIAIINSVIEGAAHANWYRNNATVVGRLQNNSTLNNIVVYLDSVPAVGHTAFVNRMHETASITNAFVVSDNMTVGFEWNNALRSTNPADAAYQAMMDWEDEDFEDANMVAFEMDDIEDISFAALPVAYWVLSADGEELPTLRQLSCLTVPVAELATNSVGISTPQEFMAMTANGTYHLTQNIDFTGVTYVAPGGGNGYLPEFGDAAAQWAQAFSGTFDGRGFALQNITSLAGALWAWHTGGVFRQLDNATVRNLVVENLTVGATGTNRNIGQGGAFVGRIRNSTVENVSIQGVSNRNYAGGGAAHFWNAGFVGSTAGTNHFRNIIVDMSSNDANFYGFAFGAIAGTIENVFVINDSLNNAFRTGANALLFRYAPTGTAANNNAVGFARADLEEQNFSALPFTMWRVGAGMPTLRQLPLPTANGNG